MNNFFKGKKVLVTGHTGFKGSWLTAVLLQWGADVVGVSLPPGTQPNLFSILNLEQRIRNHFLDIRDFDALKKVVADECPEIIFHLAAQAIVRTSYDDPLTTYSTNTLGTANILQAIHEVGFVKAAVIITTDKVYKNFEWAYPYRENDVLGGYDPYSASKAAADIIAQSYMQSFFNPKDFGKKHQTLVSIARAGNVIGGGDWAEYRLVPDIVRSIYEKDERVIIRSPRAIRPWEHVLEPLSGYLELASGLYAGKLEYSDAWNFGPDHESFVNVEELVKRATLLLGKGTYEVQEDKTKHEAGILMLDTTKAKSLLRWSPKLKFEENIDFTFSWYKNYYEKAEDPIEFTDAQIRKFFQA
ncbi:MAG: CDP-glucose 4,6-dehydratase [Patescibacteria group bacterium]